MKLIPILSAAAFLSLSALTSCSNYLDIVPDEAEQLEDTYADKGKARNYLYSCYAYLPNPANTPGGLDLLTGDEVITAFEHETFSAFPKGRYTASNPVISYWNTFFKGLRQCYMFRNSLDKNPDLNAEQKKDYNAQIDFLLAYYHFLLYRCYGPISLIKEEPNIQATQDQFVSRTPLDECTTWIADKFDEAAKNLPEHRASKSEYGLATSVAAKALKAKLLVYAASPLFNGNPMYADFKDKEGVQLMPTTYDPNKWVKAKEALKEAIDLAHKAGYKLYDKDNYASDNRYPAPGIERRLRMNILDWKGDANPEIIFADTRGPGYYDIQLKSTPKCDADNGANGISPTWTMLNRFYTKNGLPWDEDPEFKDKEKLSVVEIDEAHKEQGAVGKKTILFNLDREPRFHAWVGFQGGYYEVLNQDPNNKAYPESYMPGNSGRVILDFLRNGNQGRKERTNNYSPGGYLNKKATFPNHLVSKNRVNPIDTPWPIIRLADLYLLYAEACVETGDLDIAKEYLNKVRTRAGIPTVEDSWAKVPGATLNQAKLRDIVRQERMIELYLENQNFWDMRRWLLAEKYFNVKAQGLNIEANTIDEFAQLKTIEFERSFSKTNYLLPIPIQDINKVNKLVNNPGY